MKFSIIIAVKNPNEYLKECLEACARLECSDYEILVLADSSFDYPRGAVRIIPTGPCLPARKRDMGAEQAQGEILAFIDDDAFPDALWLSRAGEDFEDPQIGAVGGPAVTPPREGGFRLASGLVYESYAVSGNFRYRYRPEKRQFVDDYPSCNLFVRKSIFQKVGGFNTVFWPGEDTILCLEITHRLKKKILYDPRVLVYHHRRSLFKQHLLQVKNYAAHRGYFVKHFPQTSLRWQYFVPSGLIVFFLAGALACLTQPSWRPFYGFALVCYLVFVFLNAYQEKDKEMTKLVFSGILLTHLFYGLFFLAGLGRKKMSEQNGAGS